MSLRAGQPALGQDAVWQTLGDCEHAFVTACQATMQNAASENDWNFVGFVYRGVVLQELRDQTIGVSEKALNKLKLKRAAWPEFVKELIKLYLEIYGVGTSINNLILEAEYPDGRCVVSRGDKRKSASQGAADISCVRIDFGNSDRSGVSVKDGIRSIAVSKQLAAILEKQIQPWDRLIREVKGIGFHEVSPPTEIGTSKRFDAAMRHVLYSEPHFLGQLEDYVYGPDGTPSTRDLIEVLSVWLRALQGLVVFVKIFGRHWVTTGVKPPFLAPFGNLGLRPPCCALTVMADSPPEVEALLAIKRRIELGESSGSTEVVGQATAVAKYISLNQDEMTSAVTKIFPEFKSLSWPKNFHLSWHIIQFFEMGARLVGRRHEGRPLSFILLCAPATNLFRYRVDPSRRPWTLRHVDNLGKADWPSLAGVAEKDRVSPLVSSIEANAFVLQEPGRALYCVPVASEFAPKFVVEFTPFDPRCVEQTLREFTSLNAGDLAIHAGERSAKLFSDGSRVATSEGEQWVPLRRGLKMSDGSVELRSAIETLPGWKLEGDLARGRLGKVCEAVMEVAARGYGALVFVTTGKGDLKKTTLAPVWGGSHDRDIGVVSPVTLATYAGLDGETVVDLSNGFYRTRQYCRVPDKEFVEFLSFGDQGIGLSIDYRERFTPWEESRKARDVDMDSSEEICRMGTRHQKALRITWAKSYRRSTIAITVSSDGPVRLWYEGVPIVRWRTAF